MDGKSMTLGRWCSLILHAYTSHTLSAWPCSVGVSYMFVACVIGLRPGYVCWMFVQWRLGWCPGQLLWHLVQIAVKCWCRSSWLFREKVLCVSGPKDDCRILTLLVTSTLWVLGWQACTIMPGFMRYSDQTQGLHACWTRWVTSLPHSSRGALCWMAPGCFSSLILQTLFSYEPLAPLPFCSSHRSKLPLSIFKWKGSSKSRGTSWKMLGDCIDFARVWCPLLCVMSHIVLSQPSSCLRLFCVSYSFGWEPSL